jgi:all-trans-retinol dehydrogenase (NAD+)
MEARTESPSNQGGIFLEFLRTLKIFFASIAIGMWRFFVPPPEKSVFGEIVLITGSGSGIGRQLARRFARLGAVLVLWDINETSNSETSVLLRDEFHAKCFTYTVDVG